MDNKKHRLTIIQKILSEEKISNQDELLGRLQEKGFELTQATVSRDLKLLQAGKRPDPEKGSIFYLPQQQAEQGPESFGSQLLAAGMRSIQFANSLCVIKTTPGYANSIAVHIDQAARYEILGTIAGDDTILLIPGQDITPPELKRALQLIFPLLDEMVFKSIGRR